CVFDRDREPEPASWAGARGVRLVEAVEDVRQPVGRDAGPPVAHLEECADSVAPDARSDLTASVLERIADQVRSDPLETAMVRLQDDLVSFDSHPVLP